MKYLTAALLALYVLSGTQWVTATVPYYINPDNADGLSDETVVAAIQQAAAAWRLQSGVSPTWVYAGLSAGTSLTRNGRNEVFFAGDSGTWGARTYSWWRSSTGERVESDIVFNDVKRKFFGGSTGCDNGHYIDDIGTHEFGHAIGLSHSPVFGATMRPFTTYCSRIQVSLHADDLAGVRAIYSK